MAIVTISKIKNRRGLMGVDPMPQLASGELGWGIDKRELYIGNGTLEEGAPVEGNTLILSEFSDIISQLNDYIYQGPFDGADMETWPLSGPLINQPVARALTSRLDDAVTIRAFSGVGDGITDDSNAIERALTQLYSEQPADNQYWDVLHFPAGTYRITRPIQLPSHARISGDGISSTKFLLDVVDTSALAITKYTYKTIDYTPEDIHVSDVSFHTTSSTSDVVIIGDATYLTFNQVGFTAFNNDLTIVGPANANVRFSNEDNSSQDILFSGCRFSTATYGMIAGPGGEPPASSRQDISDILIINGSFVDLFQGMVFGRITNSAYAAPKNIRIIGNTFDDITKEGIYVYKGKFFTSSHNHFADVGDNLAGTPTSSCIILGDYGTDNPAAPALDLSEYQSNYSIGDTFERTDTDNLSVPRIVTNCLKSYIIDPDEIHYGSLHIEPGRLIMLNNGQITVDPTGLTLDKIKYQGAIIDYQINRSSQSAGELRRTGTIRIAQDTSSHSFSEEYDDLGTVGITLSSTDVGDYTSINYTSTSSVGNAVFSYTIRHLTCIKATPSLPENVAPILDNIDPIYNLVPPMIPVFDAMTTINAPVPATVPSFDSLVDIYAGISNV